MSGVDEYTVAMLIGDSVAMVRKHYGHLRTDHIDAEIKKINTCWCHPPGHVCATDFYQIS